MPSAAFAADLRLYGPHAQRPGEVTRAGGSLIFLRGTMTSGERALFTFSGTIKRVKRKAPPQPDA